MTVLVFPDVTAAACAALDDALPAVLGRPALAGNRVPDPRPARFIVAYRSGGTRATLVTEAAQVSFDCYGDSQADAEDVAGAARAVLFGLKGTRSVDGTDIYDVFDVGGHVDAPDPLSDQPRVLFSLALVVRGHTP